MGYASFVFLLFLALAPPSLHTSALNSDLIKQTCKNTKHYDLCISSLKSDPTSAEANDIKGLAAIMVGIGTINASATSSYLSSGMIGTTTSDAVMKKVLKECANKYAYSNDALRASLQDLADVSYDNAYMHVSAAADYPNACRNMFKRYKGLVYPSIIARREDGLKRICDVVLGIVNLLVS